MAVAVGRRPQTDGVNNREEEDDDNEHQLDDLDAALLQSLIAKRVLKLEDALKIFDAIAEVTRKLISQKEILRFRNRYSSVTG